MNDILRLPKVKPLLSFPELVFRISVSWLALAIAGQSIAANPVISVQGGPDGCFVALDASGVMHLLTATTGSISALPFGKARDLVLTREGELCFLSAIDSGLVDRDISHPDAPAREIMLRDQYWTFPFFYGEGEIGSVFHLVRPKDGMCLNDFIAITTQHASMLQTCTSATSHLWWLYERPIFWQKGERWAIHGVGGPNGHDDTGLFTGDRDHFSLMLANHSGYRGGRPRLFGPFVGETVAAFFGEIPARDAHSLMTSYSLFLVSAATGETKIWPGWAGLGAGSWPVAVSIQQGSVRVLATREGQEGLFFYDGAEVFDLTQHYLPSPQPDMSCAAFSGEYVAWCEPFQIVLENLRDRKQTRIEVPSSQPAPSATPTETGK